MEAGLFSALLIDAQLPSTKAPEAWLTLKSL